MENSNELTELRTEAEAMDAGPFREALAEVLASLDRPPGPGKAESVRAAAERLGRVVHEEMMGPAMPAGGTL